MDNDNRRREFRELRFSCESVNSGGSRTVSLPGDGPPARFSAAGQRASGGWDLREGQLLLTRRLGWEEPERRGGRSSRDPRRGASTARERRRSASTDGGGDGDGNSSQDGGKTADPDGQREAQQKHHAARQRGQDLEKRPRGEGIGGAVAAGVVHLRGLRFGNLPDYSEYQDGHVKELIFKFSPVNYELSFLMVDNLEFKFPVVLLLKNCPCWPHVIPGFFTNHSRFSSPCHSALKKHHMYKAIKNYC
ncbi:hypothetical protein Chor_014344 [Crotalus horridus]